MNVSAMDASVILENVTHPTASLWAFVSDISTQHSSGILVVMRDLGGGDPAIMKYY